jgi:hypothetical protein
VCGEGGGCACNATPLLPLTTEAVLGQLFRVLPWQCRRPGQVYGRGVLSQSPRCG